ncbi:ribonuclease T2 [Ranunculus cassubicifolius]
MKTTPARIPLPNGRSYDQFRFVLQWGRTLNPGFGEQMFTIHGLWPEDSTPGASYLLRCQSIRFDEALVKDLVPKMNYIWANAIGTNIWLWTHEYEEHGTCCELSQRAYFEAFYQAGLL